MKSFTSKHLNYLFIAAMLLILYIAYTLSFRHAFAALRLNSQLNAEKNADAAIGVSYAQGERQNQFYAQALRAYHVKKEERENRLWQSISGIALGKKVAISFVPVVQTLADDTVALQKGIVAQQFTFKGKYSNIVKLLDSIDKTPGIGRVAELKLSSKKSERPTVETNALTLQLTIVGLAR